MKKILLFSISLLFTIVVNAQVNPNNHYVNGYTKSNGITVQGHYKTNPNNTIKDNYSTYPNVNPYTGKTGTVKSSSSATYKTPTYSPPVYKAPAYKAPTTTYRAPKPIWP